VLGQGPVRNAAVNGPISEITGPPGSGQGPAGDSAEQQPSPRGRTRQPSVAVFQEKRAFYTEMVEL